MRVFIANFGEENYEWPACLERGTIATMNEVDAQEFWEAGDREGYITTRMKGKTAAGISPTRPVASRWYNLMTIVAESSGDIWIHREKNEIWWTTSLDFAPSFERKVEPVGRKRDIVVCHKRCNPWNDKNTLGNRLDWNALHPKAREFLFTESTLQSLGSDNASYALALINGKDLSPWHLRSEWKAKEEKARKKRSVATIFNARQRAAARMAMMADQTAQSSNGQKVLKTLKNKNFEFPSRIEMEKYLIKLMEVQEGICAMSGLRLQFDGEHDDAEMLCSLDRIDSAGHYAEGNLQLVCRFINRWKGADDNGAFRRLIGVLRSVEEPEGFTTPQ